MRLYLDLNCFNRPFDNQMDERVRLETEAIFSILSRVVEKADDLVWSAALTFENSRHPKPDRSAEIGLWQRRAVVTVEVTAEIKNRALQINAAGISPLDAVHLACAEAGAAGVFLTCDDALKTRAKRLDLHVRVMNPVEYWKEASPHG
jgi:predicted nucleic acid-binding protein